MKNKYRISSTVILYIIVIFIYMVFILLNIENVPLFLFLTIGSVAVLSSSTIYTIVHSKSTRDYKIGKKKLIIRPKSTKKKTSLLVEDYIDAMPLIERYIESDDSYEDIEAINDYIFTIFSPDELEKIDLLGFTKMDKIFFIREMLYFDSQERNSLIENILKNQEKTDEKIRYIPPKNTIKMDEKARVYVRSLVEPGEKTKILILEIKQLISIVKEKIGILFNYHLEDFLLSHGGILLDESKLIMDYDIDDDDEIALIPIRKGKK